MRIALPLKGKANRFFAGPVFDAEKQSAIIPIRHMKFDFEAEKIDPKFYLIGAGECLLCITLDLSNLW